MTTELHRPEPGTIEQRRDGEWVVTGSWYKSGQFTATAVRRDSLAHRVIAGHDPRVAAALTGLAAVPLGHAV